MATTVAINQGMGFVAIDDADIGPDIWEPVLVGQLPQQGSFLVAAQFGKYTQTDRDARVMRAAMDWCDNDCSRPLYLAKMTVSQFNRMYGKVRDRLRVVRLIDADTHQEVFVQAVNRYSLLSMQAWLDHCIKGQMQDA